MQTFLIIVVVVSLLVIGGMWLLKKAGERRFKLLEYPEMIQKLRQARATYNTLTGKERNSSIGKSLLKSILFMEKYLKWVEVGSGKLEIDRRYVGNYKSKLS